ncbi:hypothetical protein CCR75_002276 [Bremia lactucae]|uniref:DNA replication licensing factor MCM2 n=1 Tax=Bremia lactucae TaxID=4779 RepID=A0A976IEN7_BRELC|nr:hypothetical protein CCR75_002276 [Bremia lactucae]
MDPPSPSSSRAVSATAGRDETLLVANASIVASGLDNVSDSDGENQEHKRRRLRRGTTAPPVTTRPRRASTDDKDAFVMNPYTLNEETDNDINEEIVDELDIQERERQYFSEDELDDDMDGEDLDEHAERDYRVMETLDQYDPSMLDSREYDPMDMTTRRAVEVELNRRNARLGRIDQAFQDDFETEYNDSHRTRPLSHPTTRLVSSLEEDEEELLNLEHFDVPLREWIAMERPRQEIKRRFRHFLTTFTISPGNVLYLNHIRHVAQTNQQSLIIDIGHIIQSLSLLAAWIVEAPSEMLEILDEVALEILLLYFPYYQSIHSHIYVRIRDLPSTERLRDLRTAHLHFLIKVSGVVTRRTSVFPQLDRIHVTCPHCQARLGPFLQPKHQEFHVHVCSECHYQGTLLVNTQYTTYRNFQKLTLQEAPNAVPPGRVPRSKDVILVADLIDTARPGDAISVTGIYCNTWDPTVPLRNNFPIFCTIIEANYIEHHANTIPTILLTSNDKNDILQLSQRQDIAKEIIQSMAPSIYGHNHVKTALALALFGGQAKVIKNSRVRGDLNVLLVGDPGTAKSQFLKFIQHTAPRAVYTTGKGASAVGLTAGVTRDPLTKEWVLQGGALVLADQGVCLIDEFDKMNEIDRTSIHEAMEQQSISISKAGIVTSLQARCSVIAAANPIQGRYQAARTFAENVELTDPILQRFDLLCVLQDCVDPINDERLAEFVVSSHMKSGAMVEETVQSMKEIKGLAPEVLRKYLVYARTYIHPVLGSNVDTTKVEAFYAQLRQASQHTGAVPVAVRHLESLFRMAEAYARMHLRATVVDSDVAFAIHVLTESLCKAQKYTFQRQWRRLFRPYLIHQDDPPVVLLLHVLEELFQSAHAYAQLRRDSRRGATHASPTVVVLREDLVAKAKEMGIDDVEAFYTSTAFQRAGFRIDATGTAIEKDVS